MDNEKETKQGNQPEEINPATHNNPVKDAGEVFTTAESEKINDNPEKQIIPEATLLSEEQAAKPADTADHAPPALSDRTAPPVDEPDTTKNTTAETTALPPRSPDAERQKQQLPEDEPDVNEEPDEVLPTLDSEEDLTEKDDDPHSDDEEHEEEINYDGLSKSELLGKLKELIKDPNIIKAERKAREIKRFFDDITKGERQEALDKFMAEGGEEADFDFRNDELTDKFEANFRLIRGNKIRYVKEKESRQQANYSKKQEILEKLRNFVDSEETHIAFDTFKAIQNEWKEVGPIPAAHVKTMWANYNALVNRFYDNRHIYFELKELDRKKNYEAKIELCEKAEALDQYDRFDDAIKALNELHHEFKHTGPVPREDSEPLWQRFKLASDRVYDRKRAVIDGLKAQWEANLAVKQELASEVESFAAFDSDKIKEWNQKTGELKELQKKWEAAGRLPKEHAKDVSHSFWSAFKTFYHNKGLFFKRLDALREANLAQKKTLTEQANQLKESTDWKKTADDIKKLQIRWREIGPVPEKYRESVYREFRAACDYFFNQKRAAIEDVEKEYTENLKKKEAICDEIVGMAKSGVNDTEQFRALQAEYHAIGFVPRSALPGIKTKYSEATDQYISSLEGADNDERKKIRMENQINKILAKPNADRELEKKERWIRRQIGELENDIALWKNNMEFFTGSKNADKLKADFKTKIEKAGTKLKEFKDQIKLVRSHL